MTLNNMLYMFSTPARPQHIPHNINNPMFASYIAFPIGHRSLIRLLVGRYALGQVPSTLIEPQNGLRETLTSLPKHDVKSHHYLDLHAEKKLGMIFASHGFNCFTSSNIFFRPSLCQRAVIKPWTCHVRFLSRVGSYNNATEKTMKFHILPPRTSHSTNLFFSGTFYGHQCLLHTPTEFW